MSDEVTPEEVELSQAEEWIIQAQNRTTHAIRALVRFVLIQFVTLTFGAIMYVLGIAAQSARDCQRYGDCGASWFLIFIGSIIIIFGVITSIRACRSELKQSEVPVYENAWIKESH